jgi:hypothetical protein
MGAGHSELTCSWVINMERPPPSTSALTDRNNLHLFQVSLSKRKRKLAYTSLAPFEFLHFFPSLFL